MKNYQLVNLKNFVTVENLQVTEIKALIERAEYFKRGGSVPKLSNPVYVVNMFFENSSRTSTSFEMAEKKLGLTSIPFDVTRSSINKGETLYDTSLTMESLGIDLEVIRHPENNYYNSLINLEEGQNLDIGIVNAGDGSGQHPSQCLLDMMTIYEQFKDFSGLRVAIVGDLSNSRVARSNMELLKKLGSTIYFAGPKYWYQQEFEQYGQFVNLDDVLEKLDVVMLLRVQHERHDGDKNEQSFNAKDYHIKYGINHERYDRLKKDAVIMHPGPINRGVELADNLVEAPKSLFVKQMHNGVFMRMAMLEAVLRGRKLGGLF